MADEEKKEQTLPRPLEGIRVVEYAIWHAGPGASAILGDLGAEVIKVETFAGDPERSQKQLGAVIFDIDAKPGWSFLFELSNRNKKGICLDITSKRGREIFHHLIKSADVFMTNLRNITKPKLGIDYETLSKVNPKLIHANVSGYGTKGPLKDVGGFDHMGQAVSGMLYIAGDDEPMILQTIVLDQMTSITASHAILTALFYRERHGVGQELHVSLYSAGLWLTYANLLASGMMKENPVEKWNRYIASPLRTCFKCKDDKWIMGTNHPEEKYWEKFCDLTGKPELKFDPRYETTEKRVENSVDLITLYDELFKTKDSAEWLELFHSEGFMYVQVLKTEDVLEDPQALLNNYVVDYHHPLLGVVKIPGYPVNFGANSAGTRLSSPDLGEHTDEVLVDAGYTHEEIQKLKEDNIIWNSSDLI